LTIQLVFPTYAPRTHVRAVPGAHLGSVGVWLYLPLPCFILSPRMHLNWSLATPWTGRWWVPGVCPAVSTGFPRVSYTSGNVCSAGVPFKRVPVPRGFSSGLVVWFTCVEKAICFCPFRDNVSACSLLVASSQNSPVPPPPQHPRSPTFRPWTQRLSLIQRASRSCASS